MSQVGALSSTSYRSGTLTPPSTATNGANITRADFQRWAHEDRNHSQADMTRSERDERRRFKAQQKELFRQRGEQIKRSEAAWNQIRDVKELVGGLDSRALREAIADTERFFKREVRIA